MRYLLATVLILAGAAGICRAGDADRHETAPAPVLLVCEHGSVKSLIAASLFNQAAAERRLPFRAISRGVSPDKSVPPQIAAALRLEGFDVSHFEPARISEADVASASRVVAIGVDLSPFARSASVPIEQWEDVPAATVDYSAARRALKRHIDVLLNELQARHAR